MDAVEKLVGMSQYMAVEEPEAALPALPPPDSAQEQQGAPACPADRPLGPRPVADAGCKAGLPIGYATLPGGKKIPLVKTLLTSACERNCFYCAFRSGRDFRRETFKPEEMARAFLSIYTTGIVEGIFLSSGVAGGGIRTQDRLIDTAEVLRNRLDYRGYLHLKIMPGAEPAQIERAMQLADRVSVNLEGPSSERLSRLAPQKIFLDELLRPLRVIEEIRRTQPAVRGWKGHWPSSTTQFVVGAVGESDLELLRATDYLHNQLKLARAYFSGFQPIANTPFDGLEPVNPWRTYRLYQASFLLRDYGFQYEDLTFSIDGRLPLATDPKLAWAQENLSQTPVEVNRADLQQLLRIPGIGPRGARAILAARRQQRLASLEDLQALGIISRRAAPFILLSGKRPTYQMSLF